MEGEDQDEKSLVLFKTVWKDQKKVVVLKNICSVKILEDIKIEDL